MTKKDFEMIARVIRDFPVKKTRRELADAFVYELAKTNPRFDQRRFIAACMGEDSHDSTGRRVRYSGS